MVDINRVTITEMYKEMGLAASQARFLGLTARKTNVEYEGQQVNQQRTALANESAALYNKLLSLSVPLPPDVTEYYETSYTFNANEGASDIDGTYKINSYVQNQNGKYTLYTTRSYNVAAATARSEKISNVKKGEDETYSFTGADGQTYTCKKTSDGESIYKIISKLTSHPDMKKGDVIYEYTGSDDLAHYVSLAALQREADEGTKKGAMATYTIGSQIETEAKTITNAELALDTSGRFSKLITSDQIKNSADVNYTRTCNEEKYAQAMRDYTISKDEYDKAIADINAKTEVLQQQDKTLELRLNQLDTEQNALQTEMEAVTKVIDKNVESTFKTFA